MILTAQSLCQFLMLSHTTFGPRTCSARYICSSMNIKSEFTLLGRLTFLLHKSLHSMLYYRRLLYTSSLPSRVVETVQGVPTSRMGCSACLGVPKVCQGKMRHSCGNMQTTIKCANCATKTALKGKSVFPANLRTTAVAFQCFKALTGGRVL